MYRTTHMLISSLASGTLLEIIYKRKRLAQTVLVLNVHANAMELKLKNVKLKIAQVGRATRLVLLDLLRLCRRYLHNADGIITGETC